MNLSSDKREGIEAGMYDECMGSRSETATIVVQTKGRALR